MAHSDSLIPPRPAPQSATGLRGVFVGIRQKGALNAALSALAYGVMAIIAISILRWAWSPTWDAASLTECRDIWGDAHGKACWGVIRERTVQLLVGFYPRDAIWRPALALLLVGFGVFYLLKANASVSTRKLALLPFAVTPYLLWGGPLVWWIAAGIAAVGFVAMARLTASQSKAIRLGCIVAYSTGALLAWVSLSGLVPFQVTDIGLFAVTSRELGGFLLSILIGFSAIVFSLPLGIALALARTSQLPLFRVVSTGFIEFIRGVPLITLLFIASTLLNIFLPPGSNFDIVMRVIIMVILFAAAYVAEVIRGALAAVPKGQTEGAASLGLDYWQTQRLIILPQALKISIPGIVSTFISIFKDTTLVSIIGLLDPIGLATNIRADDAWTGIVWEIYGFSAVIFFILCFAMSQYSIWLERQLHTDHR